MIRKNKIMILSGFLGFAGLVAAVCASSQPGDVAVKQQSRPVKTVNLSSDLSVEERVYPGKVRASKRVNLSFETSGTLKYLPVREGKRVKKGEVLARLDQRDYINSLNSAKARFTEAKLRHKRSKKLRKEGIMAQSGFDAVKADYDTALAAYEIAKKALEDTELKAPFDGIVSKRYAENFEHITAHSNILSLKDVSDIEIVIQLPEAEMLRNKNLYDERYTVIFEALADKKFSARVREYSVEADPKTQTYEMVVALAPFDGDYNILPGMTAKVISDKVIAGKGAKNMFLPATAILGDAQKQKTFIYIVDKKTSKIRKQEIKVGLPSKSGVPVLSGLKGDEDVVVAGCAYLKPGMPVRIMKKY